MTLGECPMCQRKAVMLEEHHIVEAPDENGKAPTIGLGTDCHDMHEKYRNYLKDICHINIDRTKENS